MHNATLKLTRCKSSRIAHNNWESRLLQLCLACLLTLLITACERPQLNSEKVKSKHNNSAEVPSLNVIALSGPHTYQEKAKKDEQGLEFSLVKQFADNHGYRLNIIIAENEAELYQALSQGFAKIALIGQPLSKRQVEDYGSSVAYMDVTAQLIYRHGEGKPKAFDDLVKQKVMVQNLEHYHDKFKFLKQHYPEMQWQFVDQSAAEILQKVNQGKVKYAVIGSHEFLELESKYPRTRAAFDLFYPESISILLKPESSTSDSNSLSSQFDQFIEQVTNNGTLDHLLERYQGHRDDINPLGSMTFFRRVDQRLPHYQDIIEKVANEFGLDWRLLAAIAYQESHWNPHAKSHTGVRGMMMLTQKTAKEMGIENRLDLAQSLRGGAKYFLSIHQRLPLSLQEPDRTWFALAAYNVGLGHIYDARKITEFHDGDKNRWADVKQYLPLLEQESWYKYTRYGRARGSEPVNYVQHIRQFQDLLEWRFPDEGDRKTPSQISVQEAKELINQNNKTNTEENSHST